MKDIKRRIKAGQETTLMVTVHISVQKQEHWGRITESRYNTNINMHISSEV